MCINRVAQYVRGGILRIFIACVLPVAAYGVGGERMVSASPLQVVQYAGALVSGGELDAARQVLDALPSTNDVAVETERQFLLGQIAARSGDIDGAIKIFKSILDKQPDLPRVRFELALCYMKNHQWYRADYHMRLAMAGGGLDDNVKKMMYYYRWVIRQNKNWNVWFNLGAAPDNNVNSSVGGEECVMTMFGLMCRQLAKPKSAVGVNFTLGGNYEFKLGDRWRWKSDASIYNNTYNLHEYDDLQLSASTGPRYIWRQGDVWLAAVGTRRLSGWHGYDTGAGLKLDVNYDFTRHWSGGVRLRGVRNMYDKYGKDMNGYTYGTWGYLSYVINSSMSVMMRSGIEYEDTNNDIYANVRPSVAVGLNSELPWGFYLFLEPYFYWSDYRGARWVVKNEQFRQITERDFTQRYSASVSNNRLDIWGFVPTLSFVYTCRDSNIWQREFNKWTVEFTMQQRF